MKRLDDKVIFITGAAGGQGMAYARLFASEGAKLMLTDISSTKLELLVEELQKDGASVHAMEHDVESESAWQQAMAIVKQEFGRLDVLVNNAGTNSRRGVFDCDLLAWSKTLAVNLTGPLLGMKHASSLMAESNGGSIINVSSTAGLTAHADAAYCASKWGLRGLTKMAAIELAKFNIRVNSIHPGLISNTSFANHGPQGHENASRYATPLDRTGSPEECASLVMFLASDESAFVTGAEIAIDGGYSAGATMLMRAKYQTSLAGRSVVTALAHPNGSRSKHESPDHKDIVDTTLHTVQNLTKS